MLWTWHWAVTATCWPIPIVLLWRLLSLSLRKDYISNKSGLLSNVVRQRTYYWWLLSAVCVHLLYVFINLLVHKREKYKYFCVCAFAFDPQLSLDVQTAGQNICISSSSRDVFDLSIFNTSGGLACSKPGQPPNFSGRDIQRKNTR